MIKRYEVVVGTIFALIVGALIFWHVSPKKELIKPAPTNSAPVVYVPDTKWVDDVAFRAWTNGVNCGLEVVLSSITNKVQSADEFYARAANLEGAMPFQVKQIKKLQAAGKTNENHH